MLGGPGNISSTKKDALANLALNEGAQKDFDKEHNQDIATQLLHESDSYGSSSQQKQEQAQEYLAAASALDQMAQAIKQKANDLRKGGINEATKIDAAKEVTNIVKNQLDLIVPVPKDATPERLEKMADDLHRKARENRMKADDLLIDSEKDRDLSRNLKKHAENINAKNMKLSDLTLKSMQAKTEGLDKVFKMLGVMQLDSMYKGQIAIAEQKGRDIR